MFKSKNQRCNEIDNNWRIETKYRINSSQYYALKNALTPFIKPDYFTQRAPTNKYFVRSLYFDTLDFKLFNEKVDGISDRIKFRIRTYGMNPRENPDIRVEIKFRKANVIDKYGTLVSGAEYRNFMKSQTWGHRDDSTLMEFSRYIHKWNLRPKTLVQYFREGFQLRTKENIRITFDHQIQSATSKELFPGKILWHPHFSSKTVLEIKHRNKIPLWLTEIIQHFGLKVVANSKYAKSVELSKRNIIDNPVYFL